VDPSGSPTVIRRFAGNSGASPYAGLILGTDGSLYGTTAWGGTNDRGTVFRIEASGSLTTLHSFAGFVGGRPMDGAHPVAVLVQARDGNLYGTTRDGGIHLLGTVFRVDPTTSMTETLYSFLGFDARDGGIPLGGLVQGQGADDNLYGTTSDTDYYN